MVTNEEIEKRQVKINELYDAVVAKQEEYKKRFLKKQPEQEEEDG